MVSTVAFVAGAASPMDTTAADATEASLSTDDDAIVADDACIVVVGVVVVACDGDGDATVVVANIATINDTT